MLVPEVQTSVGQVLYFYEEPLVPVLKNKLVQKDLKPKGQKIFKGETKTQKKKYFVANFLVLIKNSADFTQFVFQGGVLSEFWLLATILIMKACRQSSRTAYHTRLHHKISLRTSYPP